MGSHLILVLGITVCASISCFGLILVYALYTGREVVLLPAYIRDDLSPLTVRIYNLLFTLFITAVGFSGTFKLAGMLLERG